MSKARVIKIKKVRTPTEAKFLKFGGAGNIEPTTLINHQNIGVQDQAPNIASLSFYDFTIPGHDFAPLLGPLPLMPDEVRLPVIAEPPVSEPLVVQNKEAVPVPEPYGAHPEIIVSEPEDSSAKGTVEDLISVINSTGFKVKEMKELPSGVVRISLDDLIAFSKARQPELVRVRH